MRNVTTTGYLWIGFGGEKWKVIRFDSAAESSSLLIIYVYNHHQFSDSDAMVLLPIPLLYEAQYFLVVLAVSRDAPSSDEYLIPLRIKGTIRDERGGQAIGISCSLGAAGCGDSTAPRAVRQYRYGG